MKHGLFVKFVAHDGQRDDLLGILLEAAELLRQNNECLFYIVGKSSDGPNEVWVSELWENKEAHDASLEPENIRKLIIAARPLIAEIPTSTEFQAIGGKGF